MNPKMEKYRTQECISKVELHLSGLTGTESCPNLQKIQIIGFFFENRLQWQFEEEKKSTNGCFKLHIYLRTNKTLIGITCMYLTTGGKNLSHKKGVVKYLPEGPSQSE